MRSPYSSSKRARSSTSLAQMLTAFDLPTQGRAHKELKRRLHELAIDTRHLRGQGWARGETRATHPSLEKGIQKRAIPDDQMFVEQGPVTFGTKLVRRLLRMGWEYTCKLCGISERQGKKLTLHLDHINGVHDDNRLTNLRLLCPNCHSQTETYCNRRRRRLFVA